MPLKKTPEQAHRERLFLLDGMALAYRAFFSFINRPLINSRGENTSAIYGFVSTLMKILNDEKPEHIAVVFDTKEPTFRHVMFPPYKATRQKMPEDMIGQMEKLKEVVKAFNVPSIELPGYEADDIMGTLARKAEKQGIETYLVTGDKDFMQLISPLIRMYRPGKRGDEWEVVDERGVMEKFGVDPSRVTDVLGLIGDKSDNIPGVFGVGEKTAIPLIQQYGTIENLLQNIDRIPQEGIREKLLQDRENALVSKKLVTIDVNVPIDIDLHHLTAKPRDSAKIIKLFSELEFKTLLTKLSDATVKVPRKIEQPTDFDVEELELIDITRDNHVYHTVASEQELDMLVELLTTSEWFVFDTETSTLDPLQSELVGISFAVKPREAWFVPIKPTHELRAQSIELRAIGDERGGMSGEHGTMTVEGNGGNQEQQRVSEEAIPKRKKRKSTKETEEAETLAIESLDLFSSANPKSDISTNRVVDQNVKSNIHPSHYTGFPLDLVRAKLGPVFSDPSIKKIGQNIKYDVLSLTAQGIETRGIVFDTMVASYVLRPDAPHSLESMSAEHLQYKVITYDELTGTGRDRKELREIATGEVSEYSAQDADITVRLFGVLKKKLEQQQLLTLCEWIEFPLVGVLADMEFAGVSLDVDYLADLSKEMDRMLENLRDEICRLAGETFNINSTQQLSKILFDKLHLSTGRRTKTGFSTDVWVLEELRGEHPIIESLLEYRQLQKLKSTYVDALPSLINPKTGRVHTSFNQTIVTTGRLSSSNPNLQNIPIRTEVGRSIRKAFIPGKNDQVILSADYSQIELRVMAHVSRDEGLVDAFRRGEDIHTTTAARVFGVKPEEVTKEMRRRAKEVNFGIMYGIGPYGLATRLDLPQTEARQIIKTYFDRFPKVQQYIAETLLAARRDGFVTTLLGRRRYFPDINSGNFNVRSNAERQAINMPIQGSAADMIKLAMVRIHDKLRTEKIRAKMLLQVHDELVFEIDKRDEQRAKKLIAHEMKNALPLSVPIDVEVGVGKNWLEAH